MKRINIKLQRSAKILSIELPRVCKNARNAG